MAAVKRPQVPVSFVESLDPSLIQLYVNKQLAVVMYNGGLLDVGVITENAELNTWLQWPKR